MTFHDFLLARPAICHEALRREIGYPDRRNFSKMAAGLRDVPKAWRGRFAIVLEKYGLQGPLDYLLPNRVGQEVTQS